MLRQLQELADSLERTKGFTVPSISGKGFILGHNSNPYTAEEMESYQFALLFLLASLLSFLCHAWVVFEDILTYFVPPKWSYINKTCATSEL